MPVPSASEIVSVGGNTEITFHQLQDIYNALTGKMESISIELNKSYRIEHNDLEQLHSRISQCCVSYGARVKNESVTVYHVSGSKEVFSSFDRFRVYNRSNTSPTENVSIDYSLLIIPAGSTETRQYKISFVLPSRVGLWEKGGSINSGPVDLVNIFGNMPGRVRIEYVDYAVARHFMAQIEEWFAALEITADRRFLKLIQGYSHWFRELVPHLLFFSVLVVAYFSGGPLLEVGNVRSLFDSLIVVSSVALGAFIFGKIIGRSIEYYVDRVQTISFVKLNRGDDKCIDKWEKRNKRALSGSFWAITSAIAINIVAAFIVERLL